MENNRAATCFYIASFVVIAVLWGLLCLCSLDAKVFLIGLAAWAAFLLLCCLAGVINTALLASVMATIRKLDSLLHRGRADEHRAPKSNTED